MRTQDHARLLSKGKSFECSTWQEFVKYSNDCFKQDFVTYNNVLLMCEETHVATKDNCPELQYNDRGQIVGCSSPYWTIVTTGVEGRSYIPEIDPIKCTISWRISDGVEDLEPVSIDFFDWAEF